MKFDQKYPSAKIWDEPGSKIDVGIVKFSINDPCFICKETTCWMDIIFEVPMCSEECAKMLYENWKNAYNAATDKYGPPKLN